MKKEENNEMAYAVNDQSDREYHSVTAVSNSALGCLMKSPAHLKAALENPPEDTPAFILGRAVHALTLEGEQAFLNGFHVAGENDPSKPRGERLARIMDAITSNDFDKHFVHESDIAVVRTPTGEAAEIYETLKEKGKGIYELFDCIPESINKRTKEGKKELEKYESDAKGRNLKIVKKASIDKACDFICYLDQLGGREIIKQTDFIRCKNYIEYLEYLGDKTVISKELETQAREMSASVLAHPLASKLLASGNPEVSIYWKDKKHNLDCKARLDFINHNGIIVDLKTTSDASPEGFAKSIANFGYYRQEPFYRTAFAKAFEYEPKGFLFVAVEKKPPYAVAVYDLDQDAISKGCNEIETLMNIYAECSEKDHWPAYSDKIEPISLPSWHKIKS